MTPVTAASSGPVAIESDWPCMGCGYNLRTIAVDRVCPECALPVRDSLDARPFPCADSRWTHRIWLGFTFAAAGVVGWMLIVIFLSEQLRRLLFPYILDGSIIQRLPWIILLLPTAVLVLRPERQDDRRRWWARLLLPALLLDLLVLAMNAVLMNFPFGSAGNTVLLVGYGIEPFFLTAQMWLILRAVEDVAGRIPAQPMLVEARWMRRAFVTLLVTAGANTLIVSLARIFQPMPPTPGEYWLGGFWGPIIGQIALVVHTASFPCWLYFPIHLCRFARHLHRARWRGQPVEAKRAVSLQ